MHPNVWTGILSPNKATPSKPRGNELCGPDPLRPIQPGQGREQDKPNHGKGNRKRTLSASKQLNKYVIPGEQTQVNLNSLIQM